MDDQKDICALVGVSFLYYSISHGREVQGFLVLGSREQGTGNLVCTALA